MEGVENCTGMRFILNLSFMVLLMFSAFMRSEHRFLHKIPFSKKLFSLLDVSSSLSHALSRSADENCGPGRGNQGRGPATG